MTTRISPRVAGWLALLLACSLPAAAHANSVSGSVINNSLWGNSTVALGDGSGSGTLLLGVWAGASGSTLVGVPVAGSFLDGGGLPLLSNPYFYAAGGALADGDYHVAAWIDGNGNFLYDVGEPRSPAFNFSIVTNAPVAGANLEVTDDLDADTLPDYWEGYYFSDLDASPTGDDDKDGLTNEQEMGLGTDPTSWDTDGDGMDDKWESTYSPYLNPLLNDALGDPDNDGLVNLLEYQGVDGQGVLQQDPLAAFGVARANPNDSGDVLHPVSIDTDNDGLIDSFEATWYDPARGISPTVAGDPAADPDEDGLTNFREQCLLHTLGQDGANDIWSNGPGSLPSPDSSGYRIFSTPIVLTGSSATIAASLASFRYDPANEWTDPTAGYDGFDILSLGHDTDGDLLPDGWELEHNLDAKSGVAYTTVPVFAWNDDGYFGDPDGDGLLNFQEYMGQDGLRSPIKPYINGTGDETNPNQHNWRPLSTGPGAGTSRPVVDADYWYNYASATNGTLGSARPTVSIGSDDGWDSDDDGLNDAEEIQREYPPQSGLVGTSPVHSMSPYTNRAAIITHKDGVAIPDHDNLAGTLYRPDIHSANFTLECYVKLLASPLSGTLIECRGPDLPGYDTAFAYVLGLSNNIPYVGFNTLNPAQFYRVDGIALPTNRWIHVAGVWDTTRNTLALYIDGVIAQQKQRIYEEALSAYFFSCAVPPRIGSSPDASFVDNLCIDEIRIWSEARTPAQIDSYRARLVAPSSPGLLAYFRFDDGGNTAEDFTRRAVKGLVGATKSYYLYGDHGFALDGNFSFVDDDYAPVAGVSQWGADDTDGDGLPDDWELINLLDLNSAAGKDGANGDADGDGLINLYEFLSLTNPQSEDTDQNGVLDGGEDLDQDDVPNMVEQTMLSRPDMKDTDDDGLTDSEEIQGGTNPANSGDPAKSRAVLLTGGYLDVPQSLSQAVTSWTIEAWVNPSAAPGGSVLRRTVQSLGGGQYAMNFSMGLDASLRPYGGFVQISGTTNYVTGATAVPAGTWTHVAATYSVNSGLLTLYTNGATAGTSLFGSAPVSGKGGDIFVRIGEGFNGGIDDVRLWNTVRTATQIANTFKLTEDGSTNGLVHNFRFDDGQANENVCSFDKHHQPRGAQDFLYPRDWNDEWRHAARLVGAVVFSEPGAFTPPPSLRVLIEPEAARTGGAAWCYDGGPWLASGHLLENLTPGQHTIGYGSVEGWTAPASVSITLSNGFAATITGTYQQQASLRINLEPMAVKTDATWRVDGGVWNKSGVTVSNLDAGPHSIEYGSVSGWSAPASESVTLAAGDAAEITRQYSRPYITATILPSEVVAAGARWNLNGGAWTNSGAQIPAAMGTYTVNFEVVTGWVQPAKIVLQHSGSGSTSVTGVYYVASYFGSLGTKPGQLRQPRGVAIDLSVSQFLYVVDSGNHRVQCYDMVSRTWATNYGSYGTAKPSGTKTYFNTPSGIALHTNGTLYVADMNNNRVQRRTPATGAWTLISTNRGTRVGQFIGPMGVAVDSRGAVYVADHYNHRVQKYDGGRWQEFISKGTNAGSVYFPKGVMVDETDVLHVSDYGNAPSGQNRIQTFTTNGTYLAVIGSRSPDEGGLLRPGGMASSGEFLYVADIDKNRVMSMDLLTDAWSPLAVATNLFKKPEYVAQQLRWLFVADTLNGRIHQIVVDYGQPTTFHLSQTQSGGNTTTKVAWDALPGVTYDVEYTTDGVTWFPVAGATGLAGVNGLMTVQDTAPTVPAREYRATGY